MGGVRSVRESHLGHTLGSHTCCCRNQEYIAPAKAKAIQRLLVDLCAELRGRWGVRGLMTRTGRAGLLSQRLRGRVGVRQMVTLDL